MATIILRNADSASFIVHQVDLKTDEVQIIDNLNIIGDRLYYYNARYRDSVRSVRITSATFRQVYFGSNFFEIGDEQLNVLIDTGHCESSRPYSNDTCQVYVGKLFEPIAKEIGDKSLAQCYAEIEKKREAYRKVCNIQNTLLAIGSGKAPKSVEYNTNTLALDIETFLKNRKKCLAALKPKKK